MKELEDGLVERFRAGEESAFEQVMERLKDRIYRFALRFAATKEDAEDIVVMTFTEAYRSRRRFNSRSSLETWIYQIAVHQGYRVRRKRQRTGRLDEETRDTAASAQLEAVELEQEIRRLPERLLAPFVLVKLEGLSYREAAEALGRPIGTVQAQVFEASQTIQRSLFKDTPRPVAECLEKYGYEM